MPAAHCRCMTNLISWVATAATITAACMTASNLGVRLTGYGFAVFTIGSLAWLATGILTHQSALAWTNVVLTVLNGFGVWRWLGRQARVEEGGRAAAEASETTPGEPLFPISMLVRAPVCCGPKDVGNCVDAMAGCGSGKLAYIVISEGGVAGVGETLRRLPWSDVHVEGSAVMVGLNRRQFSALAELKRDEWPAR